MLNLVTAAWIALLTLTACPNPAYPVDAAASLPKLLASHEQLFTKESIAVTFTAELGSAPQIAKPSLVQVDDTGKLIKYIGQMTDEGVMGDSKKGDRTFTRKVQMTHKKPGQMHYLVVDEAQGAITEATTIVLPVSTQASVQIIGRPSFFEVISQVWARLRGIPQSTVAVDKQS